MQKESYLAMAALDVGDAAHGQIGEAAHVVELLYVDAAFFRLEERVDNDSPSAQSHRDL
jgi:hypothetical protein